MTLIYLERTTGDLSPSSIGCSMEMGRASGTYLLNNVVTIDNIYNAIRDLIGDVDKNDAYGLLDRQLPMSHPIMPFFVQGINSIKGVGGVFQQKVNPFLPFNPEIQDWCLYNKYEFVCDFGPRPYRVCSNQVIGVESDGEYFDDAGNVVNFKYSKEWERFVDIEITPSPDYVTQQIGEMSFNWQGLPADARKFLAQPKLYLNNEILKLTWYCVPMSYYTSDQSLIRKWRGRINQNDWNTAGLGNYPAGSLLYLGANLKRFTPPLGNNVVTLPGTALEDFQKYCNIELLFSYTRRLPPADQTPLFPSANQSYVAAGHNLNPYFGNGGDPLSRTFLYTSTSPSSGIFSAPLWKSFPVEALFTNPDYIANDFPD